MSIRPLKHARTPIERAIDRVVSTAMALHNNCKGSELPEGKGTLGKLLRACARLEKVRRKR